MTSKELRRLNRRDLLELLILKQQENEELQTRVADLERERDERLINIEKAGSLAEAALVLNGIFADADKTAVQYMEKIQLCSEEREKVYDRIILAAKQRAREIVSDAENEKAKKMEETDAYCQQFSQLLEQFYQHYESLKELLAKITQK